VGNPIPKKVHVSWTHRQSALEVFQSKRKVLFHEIHAKDKRADDEKQITADFSLRSIHLYSYLVVRRVDVSHSIGKLRVKRLRIFRYFISRLIFDEYRLNMAINTIYLDWCYCKILNRMTEWNDVQKNSVFIKFLVVTVLVYKCVIYNLPFQIPI